MYSTPLCSSSGTHEWISGSFSQGVTEGCRSRFWGCLWLCPCPGCWGKLEELPCFGDPVGNPWFWGRRDLRSSWVIADKQRMLPEPSAPGRCWSELWAGFGSKSCSRCPSDSEPPNPNSGEAAPSTRGTLGICSHHFQGGRTTGEVLIPPADPTGCQMRPKEPKLGIQTGNLPVPGKAGMGGAECVIICCGLGLQN